VGCGNSATQIIPSVVNEVESLTVYIKAPPVVLPRADFRFARVRKI
jgi:cation diffusion facilitator CzcD-associated flavoprotein CzcO